eukprot:2000004-Rhodomonas_salina.1
MSRMVPPSQKLQLRAWVLPVGCGSWELSLGDLGCLCQCNNGRMRAQSDSVLASLECDSIVVDVEQECSADNADEHQGSACAAS